MSETNETEGYAPRETYLTKGALTKTRQLGPLQVRPLTAETLSYLFEAQNFFIRGLKGERVSAANANAVWATAEFIYIHAADPDEVAEAAWDIKTLKQGVRKFLAGPLADAQMLTDALPIIEQMVTEYFAAQTTAAKGGKGTGVKRGKTLARAGKPVISR